MLKHTSLIVAGALVLGMGISTASFAEMPSLDSQSYTWPGSTINTSSDTDKIAPDPKTGKRPGIRLDGITPHERYLEELLAWLTAQEI